MKESLRQRFIDNFYKNLEASLVEALTTKLGHPPISEELVGRLTKVTKGSETWYCLDGEVLLVEDLEEVLGRDYED